MLCVCAPGKLFISGEWAILEVGNPGIVAAVDKKIFVEVNESSDEFIHISIKDFGIEDLKARFDGSALQFEKELSEKEKKDTLFMRAAIEAVLKYLPEAKPFEIKSWGEETTVNVGGEIKKVGFGSSAASVVATVASLLKFHGEEIKSREVKDKIYKLATIAHYLAQGKVGSAFDVAASTYGGIFVYKRFDPKWLMKQFDEGKNVSNIVESDWPGFYVEPLEIPSDFELVVGWTKESASTSAMVKQMYAWREDNEEEYKRLFDQIAELVEELIVAWKNKDKEKILELLRKNEDYLRELGQKSGVNIETETLKLLSEIANKNGGAGKLSGAGGGDCGIAIAFDKEIAENIKKEWKENGISVINVKLSLEGVKEC
ncbi:MAG: phosphomevalonate kinase [Candidatus Diapherotrites archaeon]|nr:phosphomevalonate kinase [Candidatus Diapherotrites archaeon]